MKCQYCNCIDSKVIDSRPTEEGSSIRRRRECINCGLPYAADVEHEYTNAHDTSCNVCGTIRDLVLPAEETGASQKVTWKSSDTKIADIDPDTTVHCHNVFYLPENADEFHLENFDYIADAIDTVSAKIDLAERAQRLGIPMISCMGTGNKSDPSLFRIDDISKTSGCPLCRVMRRELKNRGIRKLNVVWSPETPVKPLPCGEETSRRQTPGSLPFVPGVAGLIMAGKIITDLVKDK